MNLTRAVIHEIIKQPQTNGATSFLSELLLPINQSTVRLAQNLNGAFSNEKSSYGNFQTVENNFYTNFTLHQGTQTDISFLEFTREVIGQLSAILSRIFFAKGGFFVFCQYSLNDTNFFSVYLVRDVEGVLFSKDNVNHTFQISQVKYLDTNKLAMGARVNIEKLTNNDNNHISLTKSNQSDISDYFIDWIGMTRPESNADFTNTLFQIISSIPTPLNPKTGQQFELNDFREAAYELIKATPNKVVNLREISNSFFGEENTLIDFAEANGYELDHEFRYDGRALNKFKRINANRDGIRLSFARGDWETKINVSENDIELVTIRSRSLADAIRQQIDLQ